MVDFTEFEERDPFNPQNLVRGTIAHGGGFNYGRLDITHINGNPVPQTIYGTPKMHYPFDKEGRFNFPKVKNIEMFDKLDGTNVFGYKYRYKGRTFISFKTRLRPFLSNNYGQFLDMWQRMLKKYPDLVRLFEHNPSIDGFSFELYGVENTHLIKYDVLLDTALLFGIRGQSVVSPTDIVKDTMGTDGIVKFVPMATRIFRFTSYDYRRPNEDLLSNHKLTQMYKNQQVQMDGNLTEDDGIYAGTEGQIWYAHLETGEIQLFKCKPHQIELIHWSSDNAIHRNVIHTTAQNALESYAELTVDAVKELLSEEFADVQINKSVDRIKKAVDKINEDMYYLDKVEEILTTTAYGGYELLYPWQEMSTGDLMRVLVKELGKDKRVYKSLIAFMTKEGMLSNG